MAQPGAVVRSTVGSVLLLVWLGPAAAQQQSAVAGTDETLYRAACAACHGLDGSGPPAGRNLAVETPDLTDCSFASREPDADWMAVIHQGGPVRKFDDAMPAFGESLSEAEMQRILDYVRTLCPDRRWPRGELNLPRSFFTEKAYPEDEAVSELTVAAEGRGRAVNQIIYEKRFGPTFQAEVKLPFGVQEHELGGEWRAGLGDVVLGVKQVLHHSLEGGTILSLGAELYTPTGRSSAGLGSGTWIAEPFIAFGKLFPRDAFLQLLGKVEVPANEDKAEREAGVAAVVGRTWTQNQWGRAWTPMVELLVDRELASGAQLEWDIAPQVQVSLTTRQHILANVGVRLPLNGTTRSTQLLFYLLWDWFDGGFFDGW